MDNNLDTTLGFYTPSFLRMHVRTNKSLKDLAALNDDFSESIYLHEFCHFVQDITTNYGLMNICRVVEYMKFVNEHILKLPKGDFNVPVCPIPNIDDKEYIGSELSKIYNGSGFDNNVTFKNHRKFKHTVKSKKIVVPEEYVVIEYSTSSGEIKKFIFGGLCILESMSYIIQTECYPMCNKSPDLPYLSAEMLVELIYPKFGKNRLNVLALCDASLKLFNPGLFFYETLIRIKNCNLTINNPEDIYKIFNEVEIESLKDTRSFKGIKSLNGTLEVMKSDAISQILGYFNDSRYLPLKAWLENMIKVAVDFRQKNETFPLEIARNGKISTNPMFVTFLKKIGTPLVTNELGETTLYDPRNVELKPDYSMIWAIQQLYSVLRGKQTHCDLKQLCNSSGISTDERCIYEPWSRNLEPDCAFGQMWRHWRLADYKPKKFI